MGLNPNKINQIKEMMIHRLNLPPIKGRKLEWPVSGPCPTKDLQFPKFRVFLEILNFPDYQVNRNYRLTKLAEYKLFFPSKIRKMGP